MLRHSGAHVLAQAVQQLSPDAKLGIGPLIKDGFYYDFDVAEPFTPEDLKALEKAMQRIVKEGQTFRRRVVTHEEALAELAHEPYKCELLPQGHAGDAESAPRASPSRWERARPPSTTTSARAERSRGRTCAAARTCRPPRCSPTAGPYMRSAAAYWRGSEKNPQLQRIYGTAWPTKDELVAYKDRLAEAERRDHRKLGADMDLFSFPDEIGSGLAVFHPKGGIIRMEMEEYSRKRHIEEGYEFVYTPHATKAHLFQISGHLDWYADGMYPPMHMDEERDAAGNITKQGQDYYLKPMNCPMHNLIFRSRGRSYRELPLRLFEFGTVYRNEKSGVVHGLTRARGFTQDDAHIYCTREQMKAELTTTLNFVLGLLKDYGLDDFYLELSTKNPEKFVGEDDAWEEATETLRQVGGGVRPRAAGRPRRRGLLRPQDLRADARRHRPLVADVHHSAGLQPARALRARVHGRGQLAPAPRDDPPRAVRLDRALLRDPHRALRGRVPRVARARAGASAFRWPSRSTTTWPTSRRSCAPAACASRSTPRTSASPRRSAPRPRRRCRSC